MVVISVGAGIVTRAAPIGVGAVFFIFKSRAFLSFMLTPSEPDKTARLCTPEIRMFALEEIKIKHLKKK